jgi:translation initiation factor IF-3
VFLEILNRQKARGLDKVRLVGNGINEIMHISEALAQAEDGELDLVLVSDEVDPPVVRIQDFKKIEYEKKKARRAQKKAAVNSVMKEIQLKVNISSHDLSTKINNINRFLTKGDKVKITVRLKGREQDNPQRARELVEKVLTAVDCKSSVLPGPVAAAILEPLKVAPIKAKPPTPS